MAEEAISAERPAAAARDVDQRAGQQPERRRVARAAPLAHAARRDVDHVRPGDRDQRERGEREQGERRRRGHRPSVPAAAGPSARYRHGGARDRRADSTPLDARRAAPAPPPGPFDYRVADGRRGRLDREDARSATRSSTASSSALAETSEVPDGEARRAHRACARTRSRATSSTSRCGWRRSTARRPRGRSRSSRRRPGSAEDDVLGGADRRRGARSPTTSARCWSGCRGRRAAISPALRRLEKRGLVTITPRVARRAPRTNPAPDRRRRAHGRPGRRAGGDRGRARRGAPAARRHRLGQDRGLPARGRGGARARRGRDRARAGDRADAADRRALRGPLRRHRRAAALRAVARASATTSGGACAPARRGSPSARARRSSRRSSASA